LVNLLYNAVKFTRSGGSIGIHVMKDAGTHITRFIVWDTGIGMSSEQIARLFRPFTQLESATAQEHQGTGLGLVLADQMAKLHKGRIDVESEPGHGSRFTVSIPSSPQPIEIHDENAENGQVPKETPKPIPFEFSGVKPLVLVVEDAPSMA